MIEISKKDIRILIQGLNSFYESFSAGNHEDEDWNDFEPEEDIPRLISVLEHYRDNK